MQAEGLCVNLNGRVHREEGLVFCGMNKVRDYPFGYKHWCARDGSYVACPQQFCGEGLEMDEHGNFVPLDNLVDYLSAKPSIGDELNRLMEQLRPARWRGASGCFTSRPPGWAWTSARTGGRSARPRSRDSSRTTSRCLGCSGHIHESPYRPGGRWMAQVGRTVWVQPGQMGHRLHYACVEISDGLEVMGVRHSILLTEGSLAVIQVPARHAGCLMRWRWRSPMAGETKAVCGCTSRTVWVYKTCGEAVANICTNAPAWSRSRRATCRVTSPLPQLGKSASHFMLLRRM